MSSVNLNNLSQDELNKILKEEYAKNKELKKKRSIQLLKKLQKQNEKLTQEKKEINQKSKSKPKSKSKSKQKKKDFADYYQECIKDKDIPKDAPEYFKKALEKAKKEYEKGIILEKSALANFAEKYVIDGKPGIFPKEFFEEKKELIEQFFKNHRNTKIRMVMICEMEKEVYIAGKLSTIKKQATFYFQSETFINIEETNEYDIINHMEEDILERISYLQQEEGTGWYFKEVISLEIHVVDYKPMKGSSYIPLPNFIMRKKAILNMENKDDKCFLWCLLRYLHPREKHSTRINDLREYENDLNFKGIEFPVKVKDIQKFENQNPNLPGVNVFSINDNNKIYPLRLNQKDAKKSIDLFLFSEDENQHYSLIKTFQD